MEIISIKNVSKKTKKQTILENLCLSIQSNEIIGFIGPSGSGKTSLVKALIGVDKVDTGEIKLFKTLMPNRQILTRIGYMAQTDALYSYLNARENLELFGGIYRLKHQEIDARINYVADVVDLKNELTKKVANYSGGMKRRLSFGIALLHNPELLILDEPTVGLDPLLRLKIWEELNILKKEGKTIIITTHAMDEADKCDCLFLIREGKIIATGSPSQLKKQYETNSIEKIFIMLGGEEHVGDC